MSSIVWKNKSSKEIKGLLISELPPITIPDMRTTITEIDGRDGDIVETLGYSSYTKTIKIGLANNYNLIDVISYFNGSGDLILSNEPDMVYKATIFDKIDFENLLRFKTANINFHVQPYKYLLNEPNVVLESSDKSEVIVNNIGNQDSLPIITLYGSDIVDIYINGNEIFKINIDDEYVTIDSLELEAYKDTTLKNRNMIGEFPKLNIGKNTITWSGNLTKIIIEPKSRWI